MVKIKAFKKIGLLTTSFALVTSLSGVPAFAYANENVNDIENSQQKEQSKINNIKHTYIDQFKNYHINYFEENIVLKNKDNYLNSLDNIQCKFKYESFDIIIDKIIENSERYSIKNNVESIFISENNELSNLLKKQLNQYLLDLEQENNNINEDMHALYNTSIVFENNENLSHDDVTVYGKTYGNYVIALNRQQFIKLLNEKNIQKIENILFHELNHIRQIKCPCRVNENEAKKFLYINNGKDVLIESSAESFLYYHNNYDYIDKTRENYTPEYMHVYHHERKFEEYLSHLTIFNHNNMEGYYNAIFDTDFNALAQVFNIENAELYKVLYGYDALHVHNDFIFNVLNKYNINVKDFDIKKVYKTIPKSYMIDIYRLYLKSIVENSDNLDYIDCLVLQEILKERMIDELYFYESGEIIFNDKDINNIKNLDNIFFKFLKDNYHIKQKDIDKIIQTKKYNNILAILYANVNNIKMYRSSNELNQSVNKIIDNYPNILYGYYTNKELSIIAYDNFQKQMKR